MDLGNLNNASTYLNNLLLARGLLRNGKSIDFARPKKAAAGTDETMAQVINLVHDLVTRRDRDAEQREALGATVRSLRADDARTVSESERTRDKNVQLTRNLAWAEGQQRSLEISARKAEASARELKEQMAKMKSSLDQVRAKCVNDVRKRDIELEKLKKHVTGMQRGATHSSGMKILQLNPQPPLPRGARELRSDLPTDDENWSLEKESNDFLAALVNETSTENTALRHIVGDAVETLKELTDLNQLAEHAPDDAELEHRQSRVNTQSTQQEALVPCEDLSSEMEVVLTHCRAILKDPSFVSIDEVQIREDEIIRLREGWEKMAGRWKDAMAMMDTWRKRVMDGGTTADLDDLGALAFTKSMAPNPTEEEEGEEEEEEEESVPANGTSGASFDRIPKRLRDEAGMGDDKENKDVQLDLNDDSPQPPPAKRLASSPARRGVRLQRPTAAAR